MFCIFDYGIIVILQFEIYQGFDNHRIWQIVMFLLRTFWTFTVYQPDTHKQRINIWISTMVTVKCFMLQSILGTSIVQKNHPWLPACIAAQINNVAAFSGYFL